MFQKIVLQSATPDAVIPLSVPGDCIVTSITVSTDAIGPINWNVMDYPQEVGFSHYVNGFAHWTGRRVIPVVAANECDLYVSAALPEGKQAVVEIEYHKE